MLEILFNSQNTALAYILIALLALLIGSLLNVVIYRLPLMLKDELLHDCHCMLNHEPILQASLNLFLPRSFCPSCKKTVRAIHNIPIVSYLFLRGRCHNCKQAISVRYPLVELISCLLAVYACWHFGFNLQLCFVLLFIWILIPLFYIDLDYQLLPDNLTLTLLWLGLIANSQSLFTSLSDAVLSAASAYLVLWLFIKLYYLITGKIGMGHGDFKLFAAFGAWFGWSQLPFILFIASMTGAICGAIYLKRKGESNDTPIAFGPFLCLAGIISLFWGDKVIAWYLTFF